MDPVTRSLLNSIGVMVLGTVLSFMAAWFWFRKNTAEAEKKKLASEHGELTKRVVDLESQLSSVKQAVQPISAAFQAILIKELTHFHTPELDGLMARLGPPNELTPEEEERMLRLLAERVVTLDGRIDAFEREAAEMLPMVLRRTKREIEAIETLRRSSDPVELAVVAVATPGTEAAEQTPR